MDLSHSLGSPTQQQVTPARRLGRLPAFLLHLLSQQAPLTLSPKPPPFLITVSEPQLRHSFSAGPETKLATRIPGRPYTQRLPSLSQCLLYGL